MLGNVVLSRDWVPGSVLLPIILAHLDRRVGHQDLVVGDARPAIMAGQAGIPGLPAPMIWYRPKQRHRQDVLVNAAVRRPRPSERLKPMRGGHVARMSEEDWWLLAPDMSVSTHAVIDDDAGRPDRGGVFTYLGLAPGTMLISDIVLPADISLALRAGDRVRLGRSRKDDFGDVEIRDVQAVPNRHAADVAAGAQLRAWCVSDVLLRDHWGAPDPSPRALAAELERRLDVSVSVVPQVAGGPVTCACRAARRDSFHTRWGRPRPSLTGLAAGSVMTFTVGESVPGDILAAAQRDGIGERTAEGFGQVRFSSPEMTAVGPRLLPTAGGRLASGETGADGLPPAPDVLEETAVKAEIARQVALVLAEGADQVIPGAGGVKSRAQWGSLREQLPRLRSPGGRAEVARWLERTRQVRQRRDVWGEPALLALERLLTDETAVWSELGLAGTALDALVLAADRADVVRASLWAHAVSVLITESARDAVRQRQAAQAAGD